MNTLAANAKGKTRLLPCRKRGKTMAPAAAAAIEAAIKMNHRIEGGAIRVRARHRWADVSAVERCVR